MIADIQFKNLSKSPLFSYAQDVPFFQQNKKVTFKPGLNILFGPNGCGKSTILRMVALNLAAEQGGQSILTLDWLRKMTDYNLGTGKVSSNLDGIKVSHDGQPILYAYPRNAVGMNNGRLDDDFMLQGIQDGLNKTSTGLKTMERLNRVLAVLHGDSPFPAMIENRFTSSMNDIHQKKVKVAQALIAPKIQVGQKTIILDEPESGLSIAAQGNLVGAFYEGMKSDSYQIIIASHSPFVVGLPGANYIDMEPGYLAHTEFCITDIHKRIQARQLSLKKR